MINIKGHVFTSWHSFLTLTFIFFPTLLFAQDFNVNLSPKHERKMTTIKSGHKRMMKYYKYYKKDSALQRRTMDKKARNQMDSVFKAEARGRRIKNELSRRGVKDDQQWVYADSVVQGLKQLDRIINDTASSDNARTAARLQKKKLISDKVNKALAKGILPGKRPYKMADSTKVELQYWWSTMKDTTQSESIRKVAKEKVKVITLHHAMQHPEFKGIYEQYKLNGQQPEWEELSQKVPGIDTLQNAFDSSPAELMNATEKLATQTLEKTKSFEAFSKQTSTLNDVKKQVSDLTNQDGLKQQGKEEATGQAMEHVASHASKLQSARNKVSKLMGKYREFSNSNDLSDAVKRTSLEGKSFKERMVIGGNFNIVSTDPFSLDLAPLLGYRFNTLFYMGLSANYRHTFGDSLKFKSYVSPANTSLRVFANYDVFRNFFAYAEIERGQLRSKKNDVSSKKWRNNYFIGIGKKVLIHPKVFMTVTALYNLNGESSNPTYPNKFQIRLGFQSSDLAFRKKKIYYNP